MTESEQVVSIEKCHLCGKTPKRPAGYEKDVLLHCEQDPMSELGECAG